MDKFVITTGDPNGIGLEITVKALNKLDLPQDSVTIITNKKLLEYSNLKFEKDYEIIEIPYEFEDIKLGQVTKEAGEFSYKALVKACELKPRAIVTAPVAKNSLHLAGHFYSGQTEILQKFLSKNNSGAEMLFVADSFRVLLLTRHCALKDITLTKDIVVNKIKNLVNTLKTYFNVPEPRIALCGFNPHAGEDGILGREELDILIPAVVDLRQDNINITMPLPADTLFYGAAKSYLNKTEDKYDCYVACYHDQGLIPIKTVAGMNTVNMTIGLDVIRTSPGHGTAFDIAGENMADETSMIAAIKSIL